MLFSSSEFLLLFLPITILAYFNPLTERFCKHNGLGLRNVILLLASLFFYAWGEPVYVFLMIASIIMTYFTGIGISVSDKIRSKKILVLGVVFHILILFVFKYCRFLVSQLSLVTGREYSLAQNIALPIGISFYTFQLMSYLFDVYYKKVNVQKNLISLGLYATMFPQLIAGPIVRYSDIEKEIISRKSDPVSFSEGTKRFIFGLGKKILLADHLAVTVDKIWAMDERSAIVAWIGAICYTLQIYFDFSGYSDMAIGLGKIFGFHFPENFNYPYISKSVTEYWQRWHMSLSSWFRDYVYIPMGGNRVSKKRWVLNIFTVWLLTGIWHGANWTYLCWGLYFFAILIIEKITDFPKKLHAFSHIYTIFAVIISFVIFRSDSITQTIVFLKDMFGAGGALFRISPSMALTFRGTAFALLTASILSAPAFPKFSAFLEKKHPNINRFIKPCIVLLISVFSISKVMSESYTSFIYFNF